MMDLRVAVATSILLLAGCLGGNDDGVAPTTSAMPAPPPVQAYKKEITACLPTDKDPIYPTGPTEGRFEIKPLYDEAIVQLHYSGEGQIKEAHIRWTEEGTFPWMKKDINVATPTQSQPCGGHVHGPGDTIKIEPGNYTVKISYAGQLSIHLEVTARSTLANANATPTHSHAPA